MINLFGISLITFEHFETTKNCTFTEISIAIICIVLRKLKLSKTGKKPKAIFNKKMYLLKLSGLTMDFYHLYIQL